MTALAEPLEATKSFAGGSAVNAMCAQCGTGIYRIAETRREPDGRGRMHTIILTLDRTWRHSTTGQPECATPPKPAA